MIFRGIPAPFCRGIVVSWAIVWSIAGCGRQSGGAGHAQLYGLFEQMLISDAEPANPYTAIDAAALFTRPDGVRVTVPLFWDGGRNWKFRISPDRTGAWTWSIESADPGLAEQSGTLTVAPSDNTGGISAMYQYPYHFQRQNGDPFYFMGETAWALYTDHREEEHDAAAARRFIDTRAAQGFTVMHSMLISEAGWGNAGGDAFRNLQNEELNPAYWQEVDRRLQYLNQQGLTGGLALAWGDKRRNPNDWREFPSQEARLRYARYIAARYSAFDVYFIVAGEWNTDVRNFTSLTESEIKSQYNEIGAAIRHFDPHGRMITIHPSTNPGSVHEFASESWMSFGDYQQRYTDLHQSILDSRVAAKPVVNAENAYYLRDSDEDGKTDKDNSADLDMIRHATWDIVMAGGYFFTGFGSTYFGGNRHPGPFYIEDPHNDDWETQVGYVKKCLTGLEWWKLMPDDGLISAPFPRGRDEKRQDVIAPPAQTCWAMAEPGRQYVFYVRGNSGPFELSFGQPGGSPVQLQQYDPRSGQYSVLGTYAGEQPYRYTPPDTQDWVVVGRVE